jgi:hypothetical protein
MSDGTAISPEQASLNMSLEDFLDKTADLKRPVYGKSSTSAKKITGYTTLAPAVPCAIQPAKVGRIMGQGRVGATITHTAWFGSDPGLRVDDQVNATDGRIRVCQGPSRDEAGAGVVWAVDLVEQQ